MQIDFESTVERTLGGVIEFLPRLVGALIILLVGWILGRIIAGLVRRLVDAVELDRMVLDTPLGRILGGTERAVSNAFGTVAKWFIYGIAILAAANVLAIDVLSAWIQTAVSYLPAFIAGLLVIVIGFVLADFIGDAIVRTRAATQTAYTQWFAAGTRMFLYFIAIVIGLDTMGIDVAILYLFARALAWGLAAAIAIGAGIAIGWGGHGYVAENIERWMGSASSATTSPESGRTTGGTDTTPGGTDSTSRGSDSTPGGSDSPGAE